MTYYVTADSFGSEIPANWEEIAAYLNALTDERGIAEDHDACNDLWEEYWNGELDGAPEAKNDVTIYMMRCEPLTSRGEISEGKPVFDPAAAIDEARSIWEHLTDREKKLYHVYVAVHKVTVQADDTRSAAEIYRDMLDDDTWPADHDVIELAGIYPVEFVAAPGRHFKDDVNSMTVTVNGRTIYAECPWPTGTDEDYGYIALRDAVKKVAARVGIDPKTLNFWHDGQEMFLSKDASAATETWTDTWED